MLTYLVGSARKSLALLTGLLLLTLLLPSLALAETAGLGEPLAALLTQTVTPLLGAVLLALLSWAMAKLAAKWKLDFLVRNQELIEKAAYKGICYAEEYAANKLKAANVKISSSEKLNLAVAQVLKAVPGIELETARDWVEALLARVSGAGATGDAALR